MRLILTLMIAMTMPVMSHGPKEISVDFCPITKILFPVPPRAKLHAKLHAICVFIVTHV